MTIMTESNTATLLERMGGAPALKAAIEEFYRRLLDDPKLERMFEDVKMSLLKYHQLAFMKVAFSQVPEDLDVPQMILHKHMRLFLNKGLNETHFDLVAQHFVQTLQHLGIGADLIDEAVGVIAPLRPVFEKGAVLGLEKEKESTTQNGAGTAPKVNITHDRTHQADEPTLMDRLGGNDAVKAAVKGLYLRMLEDPDLERFFESVNMAQLKHHQISFLKIAFTQVPNDLDVVQYVGQSHARMIQEQGLNETHFDKMLSHLVDVLNDLDLSEALIDEAASIVAKFRSIFVSSVQS